MSNANNENSVTYFDLHINGIGYLNRIREVKPKKGQPFWACDINALSGASDDVSYTRFDCKIAGADAEALVKRCVKAVEEQRKVMISFKLGDLWTDTFVYQSGTRKGETGVSLKARLLYINFIKVDGEMVYQASKRDITEAPSTDSSLDDQQDQNGESNPASLPGYSTSTTNLGELLTD